MLGNRQLFLQHVAQTSEAPLALEITAASGSYLTDVEGKTYLDLISGIGVAHIGHSHPAVVKAVQDQAARYMHVMVYGEFVQAPQVQYATLLAAHLPPGLQSVYFTNSGAEATEGAMKLAKRATGRSRIISFEKSYHGSTQGALSVMGDEYWRNAFRPLLPGISRYRYGAEEVFGEINDQVACVIVEPVQAEAGIKAAPEGWLAALKKRCEEVGALLVLDEIQTAFGRTGHLWAFEKAGIVPDILLLGKALGGGMPLGAFVASPPLMNCLTRHPVLGHITTFGGHPVSCAAGLAAFQTLLEQGLIHTADEKGRLFESGLQHPLVRAIRRQGLWLALEFENFNLNKAVIDLAIAQGLVTDWFLFAPECLRIGPPLTIDASEIEKAVSILTHCMTRVQQG